MYFFHLLYLFSVNLRDDCVKNSQKIRSEILRPSTNNHDTFKVFEIVFPLYSDDRFRLHQAVFTMFTWIESLPCLVSLGFEVTSSLTDVLIKCPVSVYHVLFLTSGVKLQACYLTCPRIINLSVSLFVSPVHTYTLLCCLSIYY